jgi:AraC family transcriptional regulator
MNRRHLPVDSESEDRPEMRARLAGRLGELAEDIQPALTSDPTDSRGALAEAYKIAAEIDIGPFALETASVILVHRGVVEASLLFAGVQHAFSQGGLAVLPPAAAMTLRVCNASFTIVYLKPEHIPGIQADLFQAREIVPQLDPHDAPLAMLLGCIREEMQSGFPEGRAYFESLALALATRIWGRYGTAAIASGTFRGGLTAKQVRQAQNTMLSALDKSVPLRALAEAAHLSSSHFCRAFKQSTGMSPHRWMREKRLERARRLVADHRMTLTEIAFALGFASLGHFSASFKRATGLTPSQYRRRMAS